MIEVANFIQLEGDLLLCINFRLDIGNEVKLRVLLILDSLFTSPFLMELVMFIYSVIQYFSYSAFGIWL